MPSTSAPNLLQDPGYLFWAPIGSSLPTPAVTASVFTDSWPVAWINLGATKDGSAISYATTASELRVAEFLDPIAYKTTGRAGGISFALADFTLSNLKRVLNGGTLTTVSGSTTTKITSYEPPDAGDEVRCMIGWESLDNTMRFIGYQCFQGGDLGISFMPVTSADYTTMSATFNFEIPSGGTKPFIWYAAGEAHD